MPTLKRAKPVTKKLRTRHSDSVLKTVEMMPNHFADTDLSNKPFFIVVIDFDHLSGCSSAGKSAGLGYRKSQVQVLPPRLHFFPIASGIRERQELLRRE